MRGINHAKLYKKIVGELERSPLERKELIARCEAGLGLTATELEDTAAESRQNQLRSALGTAINEMHAAKMIGLDSRGKYYLASDKPVVVRIERCEREILRLLTEKPAAKREIREYVARALGADKTVTTRDDDLVSTYMGGILKRLAERGVISLKDGVYSLSERVFARADDINEMLALKADFIARIHARGGEFFENYIVTLFSKHYKRHGYEVREAYVTGGSADGGIDGVIKTTDVLGFRETVMIQTKNRIELTSETDVRGFYGAVCARDGSRGIFVTASDFHSTARTFLDSIDNCIGIGGERIFTLAIECGYGIKKTAGKLSVDERII